MTNMTQRITSKTGQLIKRETLNVHGDQQWWRHVGVKVFLETP